MRQYFLNILRLILNKTIMVKVHFFTNINGLNNQTHSQSFGPVKNFENSKYRVSSIFSSTNNLKAYAVCNGKVFAQLVNGKINLVLKPTEQPLNNIPVKYYIYKGIDKDFLIDTANPTKIAISTKSKLTNIIQTSQNKRNLAYDKNKKNPIGTTTTPATLSAIGLNLTATAAPPDRFPDNSLIDEIFLRVDEDEFPSVSGGDDLGQFLSSGFGFEIVLDGLGEGPDISNCQKFRNSYNS